jgi:hypothetical protein
MNYTAGAGRLEENNLPLFVVIESALRVARCRRRLAYAAGLAIEFTHCKQLEAVENFEANGGFAASIWRGPLAAEGR